MKLGGFLVAGGIVAIVALMADTTSGPRKPVFLPGDRVGLVHEILGCNDASQEKLQRLVLAQDREAFGKLIKEEVRRKGCTWFQPGTSLHVEDVALTAGRTLVRPVGQTRSLWVTTGSLLESGKKTGRVR